ncbi:MAG: zinc-ribbon domain-containing protein [Lachnospiraceae bacterium]|nr:zinc-ribbon domain-containing protein [Lachnospiraceae bacterium]
MFCRNCGAQNNDNSNFCRECGSPLKAPAAAETVENAAENMAETVQEAAPAVEAAAVETVEAVQDVAGSVDNTAKEIRAEAENKAEDVVFEAVVEAAIAGETIANAAETIVSQAEETVAQADAAVDEAKIRTESTIDNIAEESSAVPAAGAAAVAAVAAELVSQQNANAAETVSEQPAQQYAPQQGYYSGNPQAVQAAQAVQPAQAVQAQPQKVKPPKKKAGAGRVILTIFLSLFLIIFFTVCIVEYCALKTINKDNISDALKKTDLSQMVLDSDGEELSLVEVIEDKADINISKEFDITSEQLEEIMDTPTVKKFISDNLADMAESVLNGDEPDGISKKTIIDFVKKNKKTIYKDIKAIGGDFADITMDDIDNFEEEYGDKLDNAFDSLGTDKIDMDFIAEETGMDFDISRYIKLIPVIKWIAPGLAALFIILMLLGNIGYESLTGKGVSISAMIAGAITAGAAIAFKFILDIPDSNVLKVLGLPMADMMMIVGGIAFGAGLLLLIITCIIKAIANRARA